MDWKIGAKWVVACFLAFVALLVAINSMIGASFGLGKVLTYAFVTLNQLLAVVVGVGIVTSIILALTSFSFSRLVVVSGVLLVLGLSTGYMNYLREAYNGNPSHDYVLSMLVCAAGVAITIAVQVMMIKSGRRGSSAAQG